MIPPHHCHVSHALPSADETSTMGHHPSNPLNYKQYASEMVMLFLEEPDQVFSPLTDLRNALARASRHIEERGNELVALQNSLLCMHDVLKVYKEHRLEVPKRLTAIHQRLEKRRQALVPNSPYR